MRKILLFTGLSLIVAMTMYAQDSMFYAKPFRVGIAGMVHDHVHGILARGKKGDIQIVGFAEPNRRVAVAYCLQYGYDTSLIYPSLEEMVNRTKPEAVLAFNAIYDHLKVVEYCAPRGVHVMVEKPLAVSVVHSRRMLALAKKYKIHLLTNYETTWYPSLARARAMIREEGKLGDLRRLVFHTGHSGPKEIGCSPQFLAWLTDPVLNGAGALNDFGCYGANTATWIMNGETPESVTAVTQQVKPDVYPKVDDDATILLTYKKVQVIIQASWNWPFGRKDMEAYGKTGYLFCKDATHMQYRETENKETVSIDAIPLPLERKDPFIFFAYVVRGKALMPSFDPSSEENNEIVVKILEAAKVSAATGKTVKWASYFGK